MDWNSAKVRETFIEFFKEKEHKFVPSAPMVVKNDPTLMFINAGMNQFKDLFLGNSEIKFSRAANSQKCLRVSGKHNDLEEVGVDTYHHTMFEMLGNWSFGDYFKKEAIEWAWELLTDVYKLDKERLYITIFEGDINDGTAEDTEAYNYWKKIVSEDKILKCDKKDNFWEMGETGPCGPCSEIHIDLRTEDEIAKLPGRDLVNKDHDQVIEIWNLVFIQYERMANGSLKELPNKHVDTGMGFERLCRALHGNSSNYDTDVFQDIISKIGKIAGKEYGKNEQTDIAFRVIADHLRAVSFSIADGQLPSNTGAGYVIRRILRRGIRYGYSFLNLNEAFIYQLVEVLVAQMGDHYPELKKQQDLITKVIKEEEESFLRTLAKGIQMFENYAAGVKRIEGKFAFELYDTYGFPIDLTQLLASERKLEVDISEFEKCLEEQKNRSRAAGQISTADWVELLEDDREEFIGYDDLEAEVKITRYRKVEIKGKELYQLVFNFTPFYAEGGGQVGDTGYIEDNKGNKTYITNTKKENNVILHFVKEMPQHLDGTFKAVVNAEKRAATEYNHSATHLLHWALRKVLGEHVEQKGSLVNSEHLRFDFSHFQKVTDEELKEVEALVNQEIRKSIALDEHRAVPMNKAEEMGAMMLFGEKYGDLVRVIKFGDSVELCGGTHVDNTANIGLFKITHEGAIAAGVRRIEAITGSKADEFFHDKLSQLESIKELLKNPKDSIKAINDLLAKNAELTKEIEDLNRKNALAEKDNLIKEIKEVNGVNFLAKKVALDATSIKDIAFDMKKQDNLFMILGAESKGKANITVAISDSLAKEKGWNAGQIIRDLAKEIQGGGGGQPTYATAGGKNIAGIENAFKKAEQMLN